MTETGAYQCTEIVKWFIEKHGKDWIQDNKLKSWAEKLEITLNQDETLDDTQLFHLFVLAVLWNNKPTSEATKGERIFLEIKRDYTLKNFAEAMKNDVLANTLRSIAHDTVRNTHVYNLLMFIVHGRVDGENVWSRIKRILNFPVIGDKENDVSRLRQLYSIFNPRKYEGEAYFTVKTFFVFREIRIQFRQIGKYQYHPIVCCVPDSNVRNALVTLCLQSNTERDIDSLVSAGETVAEHFCTDEYELYDLPLFLWYRDKTRKTLFDKKVGRARPLQSEDAGICPKCGSTLVWRRANCTGELYRGCTNFKGGCRWNDRSY